MFHKKSLLIAKICGIPDDFEISDNISDEYIDTLTVRLMPKVEAMQQTKGKLKCILDQFVNKQASYLT